MRILWRWFISIIIIITTTRFTSSPPSIPVFVIVLLCIEKLFVVLCLLYFWFNCHCRLFTVGYMVHRNMLVIFLIGFDLPWPFLLILSQKFRIYLMAWSWCMSQCLMRIIMSYMINRHFTDGLLDIIESTIDVGCHLTAFIHTKQMKILLFICLEEVQELISAILPRWGHCADN